MSSKNDEAIELTEHLAELRSRLIRCIIYTVFGAIIAWVFFDQVYALLLGPIWPVMREHNIHFMMTHFTEGFMFHMQVAIIAGAIIAAPFITAELWGFISPALTREEKRPIKWVAPLSVLLFFSGVAMTWFIMKPALNYLLPFILNMKGVEFKPIVGDNILFLVKMYLAFGVLFELPVVLLFLATVGVITSQTLKSYWRHAVVVIAILVAVATPSNDIFTMSVMTVPVIALYFLSIVLVKLVERRG